MASEMLFFKSIFVANWEMPTKIPKFCMFGRGFGKLRSRVLSKI